MPPAEADRSVDRNWISVQNVVFVASAIVPPLETLIAGRTLTLGHVAVNIAVGAAGVVAGLAIARRATTDLGENLRMAPTPREQGHLVDTGVYGVVRHPMYSAAVLLILGWAIVWGAISGFVLTLIALVFFSLKGRHEESLLGQHYSDYSAYKQRVRGRFIPRPW